MSRPTRTQPPLASTKKTASRPAIQQKRVMPVAPPVYRPQSVPKVLQTKAAAPHEKKALNAPPVYRPQPAPKVLQTKTAAPPVNQSKPPVNQSKPTPKAPPAYRPRAVQLKPESHVGTPPPFKAKPSATVVHASAPSKTVRAKPAAAAPPVRAFRSSVINMMPEVGVNALTTALTYDYSTAEALLQADEKSELDELWASNYRVTSNTSRAQKRLRATRAAATVKTRLETILGTPLVTYSVNFKTNHLSDADVTRTTAKTRGEARDPVPPHNTVFKESYLRGLLIADAAGKDDGEQWLRFQSPNPSNGRISLATRKDDRVSMRADDTGLYFVAVKYELSTVAGSKREKRVKAFHIETDDD